MRKRKRRLTRGEIKKKNRKIVISSFILLSIFVVGYGAFQTTLNIDVTGKIRIDSECVEGKVWEFEQEDYGQEFRVPCSREYKVELWGAQGGSLNNIIGGKGGYTSGKTNFQINKKYYIYVGGEGNMTSEIYPSIAAGGYNGGGQAKNNQTAATHGGVTSYRRYGSGGGATDIRINNDVWNEFSSLKTRIMVSSGGEGIFYHQINEWYSSCNGGSSGGLIGNIGDVYSANEREGKIMYTGGTQTSGGYTEAYSSGNDLGYNAAIGMFGYAISSLSNDGYYGAGSGYYAGGGSYHIQGSGGGSSFISGHIGCDAISEQSTEDNIIHTGQSIHYSGLYFTETVMIDGAGYKWTDHKLEDLGVVGMPTHDGTGTMTGNVGDGFAKITLLTRKPN